MVKNAKNKGTSPWGRTKHRNLRRYLPNGKYYCWAKVNGKNIKKCLKTKVITTAKLRLDDILRDASSFSKSGKLTDPGGLTFGKAAEHFIDRKEEDPSIKPKTTEYYRQRIKAIYVSWPQLENMSIHKITQEECEVWFRGFLKKEYAPTVINNSISVLKRVFDLGIESNTINSNPASKLTRVSLRKSKKQLPTKREFESLIKYVESSDGAYNHRASVLIQFLAYSGVRIGEANMIRWRDISLTDGTMNVVGHPDTGTKNWETRTVPLSPCLRKVIEEIRRRWKPDNASDLVLPIKTCRGALKTACAAVQVGKLTHHDFRHFFATRCIESGVDIPTVADWLGHRDGGALLMKTYSHIGDVHSKLMAAKVKF